MSAPPDTANARLSQRRARLAAHSRQIGVDYVQVVPVKGGGDELCVYFIPPAAEMSGDQQSIIRAITPANLRVTDAAGAPAANLSVGQVVAFPLPPDACERAALKVSLVSPRGQQAAGRRGAAPAGSSAPHTYLLEFVNVAHLDPFFSRAPFTVGGPAFPTDPKPVPSLPVLPRPAAAIDYLAKDYNSFRQLMLDQLSLLVPDWRERHETDVGIALVEIMAYAADYLSYYQDAAGTEAYLSTARRRVSVRRHARLLDYQIGEGSNARAWVHFEIDSEERVTLPARTPLLTRVPGLDNVLTADLLDAAHKGEPVQFETMYEATLYPEHNRMPLYTWGASAAVLAAGSTSAALEGSFPNLAAGDVLVFEEVDSVVIDGVANEARRRGQAVRLSEAPRLTTDALYGKDVTEVRWYADDALGFDMIIRPADDGSGAQSGPSTAALGNVVLADHGRTVVETLQPPVPARGLYYPRLTYTNLTFSAPFDEPAASSAPASSAVEQSDGDARPAITLRALPAGGDYADGRDDAFAAEEVWTPRRDLLASGPFAQEFVVETETDGSIYLRFGDGRQGARPAAGTRFEATYRVGNGAQGNVGPNTLTHVVLDDDDIVAAINVSAVCNPLEAVGGTEPESLHSVRLSAPHAFDRQERAVTPDDYTEIAKRFGDVQNAATRVYWTGSWQTAFVYAQRREGKPVDEDFRRALLAFMEHYRIIGADVEVAGPHYVPLLIELDVRVDRDHPPSAVLRELVAAFSTSVLPGGERGFFHPDNFSFGQPVYLSQIIATAMNVPGVVRAEATRFGRMAQPFVNEVSAGQIDIGPLEIARLDNDAEAPENGVITFDVRGGL